MEYCNQKTGALISTTCNISGGNWEPVAQAKKAEKKEERDAEK